MCVRYPRVSDASLRLSGLANLDHLKARVVDDGITGRTRRLDDGIHREYLDGDKLFPHFVSPLVAGASCSAFCDAQARDSSS